MEKYIFEYEMKVRDYECDAQGIVNNANYQHYLEHVRHEFLHSLDGEFTNFADLHAKGVDPVVARITLTYKNPLRGNDVFVCKLALKKEGVRYIFYQDIFRKSDNKLCLKGVVEVVCVVNGRLVAESLFDELFASCLNP